MRYRYLRTAAEKLQEAVALIIHLEGADRVPHRNYPRRRRGIHIRSKVHCRPSARVVSRTMAPDVRFAAVALFGLVVKTLFCGTSTTPFLHLPLSVRARCVLRTHLYRDIHRIVRHVTSCVTQTYLHGPIRTMPTTHRETFVSGFFALIRHYNRCMSFSLISHIDRSLLLC